ncbi:YihY/virulence factor BrkB family protein [Gandjariella thermophila]|nr:YihY/virulence factor BrkB family protein [Gandjariella thermophila]
MGAQRDESGSSTPPSGESTTRRRARDLVVRTVLKAWDGNIFSEAAEAAFWQTLSLPPLLLALLGCLGFVGDWFGPVVVHAVQDRILDFSRTVFSRNVVEQIIAPTVADILTKAHSEIISLGFIISLWAGSSAIASFVDAITVAYGQYGVRHAVLQRFFALGLYLVGLIVAVVGLPVLALGPGLLPRVFPDSWQPTVGVLIGTFYYPATAVLLVLALATLYRVALPRKLPWHRGLPGAALAMIVFLLSSIGLRLYIGWITTTGYTYGALATPIAFLLFTFFIGLAIVIGAHFNSAIEEMWPAKMTRRERRRWQRLERARAAQRDRAVRAVPPPRDQPTRERRPAEGADGRTGDERNRTAPDEPGNERRAPLPPAGGRQPTAPGSETPPSNHRDPGHRPQR